MSSEAAKSVVIHDPAMERRYSPQAFLSLSLSTCSSPATLPWFSGATWPLAGLRNHQGSTCVLVLALAVRLLRILSLHINARLTPLPPSDYCLNFAIAVRSSFVTLLKIAHTSPYPRCSLPLFLFCFSPMCLSSFLLVLFFTIAFPAHRMCSLNTSRENK